MDVQAERRRQAALPTQQHVAVEHTILPPPHLVLARGPGARRLARPLLVLDRVIDIVRSSLETEAQPVRQRIVQAQRPDQPVLPRLVPIGEAGPEDLLHHVGFRLVQPRINLLRREIAVRGLVVLFQQIRLERARERVRHVHLGRRVRERLVIVVERHIRPELVRQLQVTGQAHRVPYLS